MRSEHRREAYRGGSLSTNWRASRDAWAETLALVGAALMITKLLTWLFQ